VAAVVTEL
jgi:hypothetical protein